MTRTGIRSFARASRFGLLFSLALGVFAGGGCSASKRDGTDSSTHWTFCKTAEECPKDGGVFECRDGRCVAAASAFDSGAPGTGGASATTGGAASGNPTSGTGGSSAGGASGGQSATGGSAGATSRTDAGASTGGRAATQSDAATPDADISDGGPLTACERDSDCALVNATCCGRCGEAGPDDKLAVNAAHVDDWYRSVCGDGGACPPCIPLDGPYDALCDHGHCVAGRLGEVKVCLRSQDCGIKPKDCCPCGNLDRNDVVSLNPSFTDYPACTGSCPACPGGVHLPDGVQAACYQGGYCIME